MEAASIYALSSGLGAVVSSPQSSAIMSWVGQRWAKYKLRRRLSAAIVIKGKTSLCSKLSDLDTLFLDLDELYSKYTLPASAEEAANNRKMSNPLESYLAYPLVRDHIIRVAQIYKNRIVLVSSSLELIQAMPVYSYNIHAFVWSGEMEKTVGILYANEQERQAAEVLKFRTLRNLEPSQVTICESISDLEKQVKSHYNITKLAL